MDWLRLHYKYKLLGNGSCKYSQQKIDPLRMLKRVNRLAAQEQRVKVAKDEGVTRADLAYGQVKYTSPLS